MRKSRTRRCCRCSRHSPVHKSNNLPCRAPQLIPSALPRAAALLHFIATGREELYEFELGIIKVLLGLRLETPLAVSEGLLVREDREECDALLRAAIGHWNALKTTSIDGLR